MLGLRIDLDYPGSSFIEHISDSVYDYLISRSFHDFFVDILNLEKSEQRASIKGRVNK
jgi:hypothetical protein